MTLYLLLALAAAGLWIAYRLRRGGRIEAEHDALTKTAEVRDAQLEAAANAPADKRELVDRLRSNGL